MKILTTIRVQLGERSYPIQIGQGWIEELGKSLRDLLPGRRFCIVTNPQIEGLWAGPVAQALSFEGLPVEIVTIPDGEAAKNLESVSQIYDFLIERQYDRGTAILALGGGVIGDVTGFAAATFLRGVDLVQLPTTLLAMVDSSVGGKTGVNHRLGKNLIGAFWQPKLVATDLDFLKTLPAEEFRSGMAEVVKYGMIYDAEFFGFVESNIREILAGEPEALLHAVARSCEIKAAVVSADETESGLRAILNFGHTFAHAVETLSDYSGIRHGEAVAMGMVAAGGLGNQLGTFPAESIDRLRAVLETIGLPVRLRRFPVKDYLNMMKSDKKARSGRLRFVVPVRIGEVALRGDIEESAVIRALESSF
jgi:3-dehydroquinate synthase